MTDDHPLRAWMRAEGLSQTELAAKLGISTPHLSQLLNGHKEPSIKLAKAIYAETEGVVGFEAWASSPTEAA